MALLGVKPEVMRYYVGKTPETYTDVEAAARWLFDAGHRRRWLTFSGERLAEVNAAFRSVSAGRNLAIVDPPAGSVLLAASGLIGSERNHNPLEGDLLRVAPPLRNPVSFQFGNAFQLIGWEVIDESGASVVELVAGGPYELRFVFRVLDTTSVDWEIFVHLDGRGRRHNGDHEPARGRYPTTLWQPNDIVLDRHTLVLDRAALAGTHTLYLGMFRGNRRLEVTGGVHEDNRVRLGELEVH
jgi:hypothetical protein